MKILLLLILSLFFTLDLAAQVIFRNDFVINRKEKKILNLGLTTVTVNLGRYPNWNQLINGRGGRTMLIDIRALRHRKVTYTYQEVAEKVYAPAMYTPPVTSTVPLFLLWGPYGRTAPITLKGAGIFETR